MKDWWIENNKYMRSLGMESCSGTGSTLDATKAIREELPHLLKSLDVLTMLDIPCGDGYWMMHTDLEGVSYWGADIVPMNIEHNISRYGYRFSSAHQTWMILDITKDRLPAADLIFCRDCLVHFSTESIWEAIRNIIASGSKYLLTTTFIERKENHEIPDGGWQTLNLQIAPFNFPEPIGVLDEHCTEQGGIYSDKKLGLWRIADLRACLPVENN